MVVVVAVAAEVAVAVAVAMAAEAAAAAAEAVAERPRRSGEGCATAPGTKERRRGVLDAAAATVVTAAAAGRSAAVGTAEPARVSAVASAGVTPRVAGDAFPTDTLSASVTSVALAAAAAAAGAARAAPVLRDGLVRHWGGGTISRPAATSAATPSTNQGGVSPGGQTANRRLCRT